MKNKNIIYVALAGIALIATLYLIFNIENNVYNWAKTYSSGGKNPYDFLLFERALKSIDKDHSLKKVVIPFRIYYSKDLKGKSNQTLVHTGEYHSFDKESIDSLVRFMKEGNHMILFEENGVYNLNNILFALLGDQKDVTEEITHTKDSLLQNLTVYKDSTVAVSDTLLGETTKMEIEDQVDSITNTDVDYSAVDTTLLTNPIPEYTKNRKDSCAQITYARHQFDLCYYNNFKIAENNFYTLNDSLLNIRYKHKKYDHHQVLATDGKGPVIIKYHIGKGSLTVCSNPMLISNYFLKNPEGYTFLSGFLKGYTQTDILINNYEIYNTPNGNTQNDKENKLHKNFSPLKYILQQESLAWAFYIFIALLVIFFVFFTKRRIREIPIVKSRENTTIEYVETISRLYQSKEAHGEIMEMMAKNFLKFVQNKYQLKYAGNAQEFAEKLAKLSKIDSSSIGRIISYLDETMVSKKNISAGKLEQFYKLIHHFYKNCK